MAREARDYPDVRIGRGGIRGSSSVLSEAEAQALCPTQAMISHRRGLVHECYWANAGEGSAGGGSIWPFLRR